MLSNSSGNKLNKYVKDYVVFDLETTGFSAENDTIIEISAVKVRGGEVIDEFSTLVNPNRPIPARIEELTGISDSMVDSAPVLETALQGFVDFIDDNILVGHNIHSFDLKFIYYNALQLRGKTVGNDYIDTLELAKAYLPQLPRKRLVDIAEHYGISSEGAHRAVNDCRMNQKIFEELAKEISNPNEEAKKINKCPRCGSILKIRNGMYGEFWGCTGYPICRYTANV